MVYKDEKLITFLEHHGIKGMHWGIRQKSEDNKKMSNKKKAAIILGSAAAITAISIGAIYAKKRMHIKISNIVKPKESIKNYAEAISKEPVGIVHAARGKNLGFTFIQRGGLTNPVHEYDKAGFNNFVGIDVYKRYGDRSEKIAARILDPENRKDFSGRQIFHELMLPESMSKGVSEINDVRDRAWPLIKDIYQAFWDSSLKNN